jgi:hypothetical protein
MTKEERYKKAMAYIDSNKMSHVSEIYWGDQTYENRTEVVSVYDAKLAIEIALGKA